MNCQRCNAPLLDTDFYCPKCGYKQVQFPKSIKTPEELINWTLQPTKTRIEAGVRQAKENYAFWTSKTGLWIIAVTVPILIFIGYLIYLDYQKHQAWIYQI